MAAEFFGNSELVCLFLAVGSANNPMILLVVKSFILMDVIPG